MFLNCLIYSQVLWRFILFSGLLFLFLNPTRERACHNINITFFLLNIVWSFITCRHALATLEAFTSLIVLLLNLCSPLPNRYTYLLAVLISGFLFLFLSHCFIFEVIFNFLTLLLVKMKEFLTLFNHVLFIFIDKNWLHNKLIKSMKIFWTSLIHSFGPLFVSLEVWMQNVFFRVLRAYWSIKTIIASIIIF